MPYPVINSPSLNNSIGETHDLWTFCTLKSAVSDADVRGFTDIVDHKLYLEIGGVQPSSSVAATSLLYLADSDAGFPSLDSNAAPAVIGSVIYCENTNLIVVQEVPTALISSASMSAGVVTKRGASSTGISASKNLCTSISCTGLDLESAAGTHTFFLHTIWKSKTI